jgi:hypothetical protein
MAAPKRSLKAPQALSALTATGLLFASKSHAVCSRLQRSQWLRSLKAPQARLRPSTATGLLFASKSHAVCSRAQRSQ